MRNLPVVLLTCVLLYAGCDTGLSPIDEPSGITGVIRFSNWPPPDSCRQIRLAAFESYPADSSGILLALVSGKAVIFPATLTGSGLDRFVDSLTYEWTTKNTNLQVAKYDYFVVAWQYGPNIFSDWAPAGVYTVTPNSSAPAPVRVLLHRISRYDINVDFHNLPPKPWR
jgi:hypothetical protein